MAKLYVKSPSGNAYSTIKVQSETLEFLNVNVGISGVKQGYAVCWVMPNSLIIQACHNLAVNRDWVLPIALSIKAAVCTRTTGINGAPNTRDCMGINWDATAGLNTTVNIRAIYDDGSAMPSDAIGDVIVIGVVE